MEVWLIYRTIKTPDGKIDKIQSVEYCSNERDAQKYSRLFDLQTPMDLRDRIHHKYYVSNIIQD